MSAAEVGQALARWRRTPPKGTITSNHSWKQTRNSFMPNPSTGELHYPSHRGIQLVSVRKFNKIS
jgi:hypothetical protein